MVPRPKSWGFFSEQAASCGAHRHPQMVDVKARRCRRRGCSRTPYFAAALSAPAAAAATAGEGAAWCSLHRAEVSFPCGGGVGVICTPRVASVVGVVGCARRVPPFDPTCDFASTARAHALTGGPLPGRGGLGWPIKICTPAPMLSRRIRGRKNASNVVVCVCLPARSSVASVFPNVLRSSLAALSRRCFWCPHSVPQPALLYHAAPPVASKNRLRAVRSVVASSAGATLTASRENRFKIPSAGAGGAI